MSDKTSDSRLVPGAVLSAKLGVSAKDLRREALEGRLPHVRVGDHGILFEESEVIRALLARAKEAAKERSDEG
jgi:hypothetical protein